MTKFRTLFFALVAFIVSVQSAPRQDEKVPITLDDFLLGTLSAGGFGGSWVPGSGKYVNRYLQEKGCKNFLNLHMCQFADDTLRVIEGNNIIDYNLETKVNNTIVSSDVFEPKFVRKHNFFKIFQNFVNYIKNLQR